MAESYYIRYQHHPPFKLLAVPKDIDYKKKQWENIKDFVPYIRYVDPAERERFMQLSQQKQTRELLLQNLELVAEIGGAQAAKWAAGGIWKGFKKVGSPVFRKMFPKTTENIIKSGKEAQRSLPKYAGSVNLERQAISNEAKKLELEMWEQYGVKTTISNKEMVQRGQAVVKRFVDDPGYLAKRTDEIAKGAVPDIEEGLAYRMMNAENFEKFVSASKQVEQGTLPKAALKDMQESMRKNYLDVTQPYASDAGRRLQAQNIMVGRHKAFDAINKLKKDLNPRQLRDLNDVDWEDSGSIQKFVKDLSNPKLKEYVYEYWYNAILSGIPTHVVNIASNTMWRMFQVPHRALTGAADTVISLIPGRKRTRFASEVIPMMAGYLPKRQKAARSAWQMARHGKVTDFETKWAQELGGSLGAFDRSPSKIIRGAGKLITPPTRALRAADVYANSIAYDSQMAALAHRASKLKKLSGAKAKEFKQSFVKNPPEWAHKEAMGFAKYSTFMDDPGFFTSAVIKVRGKIPGGRLVVPFVNTIGNLMKRGAEMTPGLGLTLAKGQNPAEVVAKQIEGAIVGYFMLQKAEKGEITGAAPAAENERKAFYREGKKAWSIKVGDTWYQYRRVEPFNTVIASVAIAHDRIKNAKNDEEAAEIFLNMANDLKNNLIDSSYMQGVTQIINRHGSTKGVVQRTVSGFVPYSGFFRSVNRAYEVHSEGSAKLRETNDWLGAFSMVIPGLSTSSPAKLDVWGEEIELEGGVFRQWLPYKWSTEKDDPSEKALAAVDMYPGLPDRKYTYKGVKKEFNPDIYRKYAIDYGHRAKKWLDSRMKSSTFQRALKDEKHHEKIKKEIKSEFAKIRYIARIRAIREQLKSEQ